LSVFSDFDINGRESFPLGLIFFSPEFIGVVYFPFGLKD
jgi:hypothetical protein